MPTLSRSHARFLQYCLALVACLLPCALAPAAPYKIDAGPINSANSGDSAKIDHRRNRPHPAVARIIVPEGDATSFGSGTLVDVRDQYGLVITNWHVVRDARGPIEVLFPNGFHSQARALKVDSDWDLAALVIWRPETAPIPLATRAPQPGDELTICGYGHGIYRAATGRCTQYYAPQVSLPRHMVELDVQARQGDSGGPIFNRQGELAGVLFGAGRGTTLGSFGGRVGSFLATLAPDIGAQQELLAEMAPRDAPGGQSPQAGGTSDPFMQAAPLLAELTKPSERTGQQPTAMTNTQPSALLAAQNPMNPRPNNARPMTPRPGNTAGPDGSDDEQPPEPSSETWQPQDNRIASMWQAPGAGPHNSSGPPPPQHLQAGQPRTYRGSWISDAKSALAAIGLLALAMQLVRVAK